MSEAAIKIGGIIQKRNLAKLCLLNAPHQSDVTRKVFAALGGNGVNVSFIVHTVGLDGRDTLVLCVSDKQVSAALHVLEPVKEQVGAEALICNESVGMVAIFGPHFSERPGIAERFFAALQGAAIDVQAISTSISTLSCLIDSSEMDKAIQALKKAFEQP